MVQKFKKRPIVIEALQWTGENHRAMFDFFTGTTDESITTAGDTFYIDFSKVAGGLMIRTLEGDHQASIDDWIIKGIKGEFYPCKPDIFTQTYIAV